MFRQLLFIFALLVATANGQPTRRGYVGISAGPGIALGKFAAVDGKNAGYAKTGLGFDINFAYLLDKKFGIAVSMHSRTNAIDTSAIVNTIPSDIAYEIKTGQWISGGMLAGIYFTTPFSNESRFSFESKLMVGFVTATLPSLKIILYPTGLSPVTAEHKSANTVAFGILTEAGVRYNLSEKFCLRTSFQFLPLETYFRNVESTIDNITSNSNITQSMSGLDICFGIALRLK